MTSYLPETKAEFVAVEYFCELGCEYVHAPVIPPDGVAPERADFGKEAFWVVAIQCIVAKTPEWRTPITESL